MRGKDVPADELRDTIGITPAYAGKRIICTLFWLGVRDHPRLCGEKHDFEWFNDVQNGITPAYAGKSTMKCKW